MRFFASVATVLRFATSTTFLGFAQLMQWLAMLVAFAAPSTLAQNMVHAHSNFFYLIGDRNA